MVLEKEIALSLIANDKAKELDFLDSSHVKGYDDNDILKACIQLLDWSFKIKWANEFYRRMDIDKTLNSAITFDLIGALVFRKSISEEQLKKYFETTKSAVEFYQAASKISDTYDGSLFIRMELILLGMPPGNVVSEEGYEQMRFKYAGLINDFYEDVVGLEEFLDKAKKIVT